MRPRRARRIARLYGGAELCGFIPHKMNKMKSVFDFLYRPEMSDDEWRNLMRHVERERENDFRSQEYFENVRKKKEAQDAEKIAYEREREIEREAYEKRRAELEEFVENGKKIWANEMKRKWGW